MTRASRVDRFGVAVACPVEKADAVGAMLSVGRGRGGAAMMKYVFVLVLLVVGGVAGVLGLNVGYRWFHNMTESPRIMPGERAFSMPPGSVPRGGELRLPKEEREAAALRRNPIPATPASVQKGGELFVIYCTPCHGAPGKGDGLGEHEVRAARRSDQCGPSEGPDGRLLAELPERGGRRDAVLR